MSNLNPTPRTDKNGRVVIRHMKPNDSSSPARSLPAPANPSSKGNASRLVSGLMSVLKGKKASEPSPLVRSTIDSLRRAYAKRNIPDHANGYISKAEPVLSTYSDVTLERMQNHPWSFEAARNIAMSIPNKRWTETTVNDYMAVARRLGLIEGESISIMHADSWHLYDLYPANNDGDFPQERLSQLVALYRVTEYMQERDEVLGLDPYWYDKRTKEQVSLYLNSEELRELVLHPEEPYKREDIVDLILTHDVFDAGRIKGMLDNGTTSLSSGVL